LVGFLAGLSAVLAGCTKEQLLEAQEEMREEIEMLSARLARLEADTAKHSRKIQEISELEETRAEEAERDEPVSAEDLAVGRPVGSAGSSGEDAGAEEAGRRGDEDPARRGPDGVAEPKRITQEAPTDPFTRRVQLALERAHYDPGPVDGKAGAKTKKAIREFQRENNLPETGMADEATWDLLKRYLE
jgi:hypothetical protein